MSATQILFQDWQDSQEQLDQAVYEAQAGMARMVSICWAAGSDQPYHAPDSQWLAETRTQLAELQAWLEEMQAARDCYDAEEI